MSEPVRPPKIEPLEEKSPRSCLWIALTVGVVFWGGVALAWWFA